jgi:hypothetical protein
MLDTNMLWIIGLGLVATVAAIFALVVSRRRTREQSEMLRERFGPEYTRAVQQYGVRKGERELLTRTRRVERITFRELSPPERARYSSEWTAIQAMFVDNPAVAAERANDLIKQLMRARGYSADEGFEQRAADLSVDHPDVVEHYRAARVLAQDAKRHGMNTEELRQAIVHYRVLFADLLQPPQATPAGHLRPAHA